MNTGGKRDDAFPHSVRRVCATVCVRSIHYTQKSKFRALLQNDDMKNRFTPSIFSALLWAGWWTITHLFVCLDTLHIYTLDNDSTDSHCTPVNQPKVWDLRSSAQAVIIIICYRALWLTSGVTQVWSALERDVHRHGRPRTKRWDKRQTVMDHTVMSLSPLRSRL